MGGDAFRGEELIDRLYRFPKPTIAAVTSLILAVIQSDRYAQ
jgi:enoyl-CoA hydratase/carnithine racemase